MQVGFKSLLTLHLILSRSLAYHSGKVFVGDIGKNRVFVLDNTMEVETIGETGNGRLQFKVLRFWSDLRCCLKCSSLKKRLLQGPSCLVADSKGSVLVVDSHNHRIQLLNPDFTFGAKVKVIGKTFSFGTAKSKLQRSYKLYLFCRSKNLRPNKTEQGVVTSQQNYNFPLHDMTFQTLVLKF